MLVMIANVVANHEWQLTNQAVAFSLLLQQTLLLLLLLLLLLSLLLIRTYSRFWWS